MTEVVIVDAVRTPMGKSKNGQFRNVRAEDLSAHLIKGILARNEAVKPADVDDVIWGCVQQTLEQGFNIARNAGLLAGLPHSVPGQTVNRLCGSSMSAIHIAASNVLAGQGDIYLCGGVEHMGHVPMTHGVDINPHFSLVAAKAAGMMGLTAEMLGKLNGIDRKSQDEFALESHRRAVAAQKSGVNADQVLATEAHDEAGKFFMSTNDEVAREDANLDSLMGLRPVFDPRGTVTAGNSSALSDGAAAVLVMSAAKAKELGLTPLVKIRGMGWAGCDPSIMGRGPVPASQQALKKAGVDLKDIDYFELNEAFAAQSLAVLTEMKLLDRQDVVNVRGGAIALGHPLGCSGSRITGNLAHILNSEDGTLGLATMCIGMGQGVATVMERVH